MTASDKFLSAFLALPSGTFYGRAGGKTYVICRTTFAGGRSFKLVAHELGGPDYISLNLYLTRQSGGLLRPCEMPPEKVVAFVLALIPDVQK